MIWVVSLSTTNLSTRSLTPVIVGHGIRSLVGFSKLVDPLAHLVLYPHAALLRGYTSIYFGENELSPSLISLSPPITAHLSSFQPTLVRPSTLCY